MNVAATLSGKELDASIYTYACEKLGKKPSQEQFDQGYARGEFHFLSDAALLGDLINLYQVNLHRLGGEWLAFRDNVACYGITASEAVCRWVLAARDKQKAV